ncbi:hypothetical protein EVAR_81853_1 [Eumeta japonica]|uniref:Uncharacterized protein n=1 Tax=Eumeta variegata TaxID=151549 RepID=A0A4C1ZW39_EUMVA|nr:hypothetical protein EVAR_81853_1 [Eumeta japonica]
MPNEGSKETFIRHSVTVDRTSIEQLHTLNLQHGKKLTRKISSDYVKTMDTGNILDRSIRSAHYARRRPSLTIAEYRTKVAAEKEALLTIFDKTPKLNTLPSNSEMICQTTDRHTADVDEEPSLASFATCWQTEDANSNVGCEEPHDGSLELQNLKNDHLMPILFCFDCVSAVSFNPSLVLNVDTTHDHNRGPTLNTDSEFDSHTNTVLDLDHVRTRVGAGESSCPSSGNCMFYIKLGRSDSPVPLKNNGIGLRVIF